MKENNLKPYRRKLDDKLMVVFVIDKSGSMHGSETEIARRFMLLMDQLRSYSLTIGTILFSYPFDIKFAISEHDPHNYVKKWFKPSELCNIFDYEHFSYFPQGSTALYDSIAFAINEVNDYKKANKKIADVDVLYFIITDGYENDSWKVKYSLQLEELIKTEQSQTAGKRKFFFMAEFCIDVIKIINNIGIDYNYSQIYTKEKRGLKILFDSIRTAIHYDFTDENSWREYTDNIEYINGKTWGDEKEINKNLLSDLSKITSLISVYETSRNDVDYRNFHTNFHKLEKEFEVLKNKYGNNEMFKRNEKFLLCSIMSAKPNAFSNKIISNYEKMKNIIDELESTKQNDCDTFAFIAEGFRKCEKNFHDYISSNYEDFQILCKQWHDKYDKNVIYLNKRYDDFLSFLLYKNISKAIEFMDQFKNRNPDINEKNTAKEMSRYLNTLEKNANRPRSSINPELLEASKNCRIRIAAFLRR